MATKYAGAVDFVEQPSRRRFRSGDGWSRVRIWRGATTKLDDFLNSRTLDGSSNVEALEDGDGFSVVTADFAVESGTGQGSSNLVDPVSRTWTLQGNDVEVTPFALPKVQAELKKIGDITVRAQVIADIQTLVRGDRTIEIVDPNGKVTTVVLTVDLILGALSGFSGINIDLMRGLIEAMASGVEAFPVSQYVLRKTETVIATVTGMKAQHLYVGKMLTYSQLTSHEPTLDAALLIEPAELKDDFWLKRSPTVDQVNRGQFQITQEYWAFKDFNSFVYESAS